MNKFIYIILILFIILIIFMFFQKPKNFPDHDLVKIKLGDKILTVEVVNTPASITQGLSGRDEIGSDGMLFILGEKRKPGFWMKNMKFDLDMIWLENNKIVDMSKNIKAPAAGIALNQLPTYSPKQLVDMVLEIKAGKADEWGLKINQSLSLTPP